MDFEQYCKDKIDIGVFNLKLSQDEFVSRCKRCFGIGGMSSQDISIEYGFGRNDFTFEEKSESGKITKFAGSWAELFHLLRQKYGKEDKQLTLW